MVGVIERERLRKRHGILARVISREIEGVRVIVDDRRNERRRV